jgi:hypothetical protein
MIAVVNVKISHSTSRPGFQRPWTAKTSSGMSAPR